MEFIEKNMVYLLLLIMNIVAVLVFGRKSPVIFISISIILIMLFQSKNKLKLAIFIICGIVSVNYVITHYFLELWNELLSYQKYWYNEAKITGEWSSFIFSGRDSLLASTWKQLNQSSLIFIALLTGISPYGLGTVTGNSLGLNSLRGIEIDPFEILLSYGFPITIAVYSIFIKALKTKTNNNNSSFVLNLALICTLIHSCFGGHTVTEAVAASYSAYLITYKYCLSKE